MYSSDSDSLRPSQKKFLGFRHLWKVDDPSWMKDRKQEWAVLNKNFVADIEERTREDKAYFRDYFIYGKETEKDLLWRIMSESSARFHCTPWVTAEDASSIFRAITTDCDDRGTSLLIGSGLYKLCALFSGLDSTKSRVALFLDAIFYPEYRRYENRDTPNEHFDYIFSPAQISISDISIALACLTGRKNWDYCYVGYYIPFLLEQVNRIEAGGGRAARNLDRLTDILFGLKKAKTKNPSHLEMMENLRAGFTSSDAPQWLRDHCKAKIKS